MIDVRCWRCEHKLCEVVIKIDLPPLGVVVRHKCTNCKAINSTPLDTLVQRPVAFA